MTRDDFRRGGGGGGGGGDEDESQREGQNNWGPYAARDNLMLSMNSIRVKNINDQTNESN